MILFANPVFQRTTTTTRTTPRPTTPRRTTPPIEYLPPSTTRVIHLCIIKFINLIHPHISTHFPAYNASPYHDDHNYDPSSNNNPPGNDHRTEVCGFRNEPGR